MTNSLYGLHIEVGDLTQDYIFLRITIKNRSKYMLLDKHLIFNLAIEPFNNEEIRKNYKMSVVLSKDISS